MAFSSTEIQTVKNLMGYGNLTALALPYIDVALVFETVVQNSTDAYGEGYIRTTILPNVAQIDIDIQSARTRYKVKELTGDAVLDTTEHQRYLGLREYWLERLSETLRIPRAKTLNSARVEVL